MKKSIICMILMAACMAGAFAGDVAVFEEMGFSADGKTYIFAQYGKTDKTYEAWAEIYTVDVAANEYVKGEVFKTEPGKAPSSFSGKQAFEALKNASEWKIAKYKCEAPGIDQLLYLRENESKKPTDEIVFKDFEASTEDKSVYYHVQLVPTYKGSGKNVKSCYYIDLKKEDENGTVLSQYKVGTPDFYRNGITSYKINRISSDKSGKSLVFIIEKTLEDDKGTSIRYMVETITF